ncbi:glycosyltransferase family 2 protein [Actinoallomurus sp. CA-150999]|uniref:glycosyltransferase family 2 protein n=1 Tax=Actinoallomurus sp. CA-150999 TaxID=3239887 RepID=UPI003D905683
MTRVISIITAAYEPVPEFLHAAYESILVQELPPGWAWQWVVQEDGETGDVAALLPEDPRVSPGHGRRGGAGVARTLALSRARGELVKVLDADDLLTPGALARDIDVLERHPDLAWATSRALDLLPDGSRLGVGGGPPVGRLARGTLLRLWQENGHRLPVVPATLCVRRELLFALGGWMALPASEDTGLLLAADAVGDGYFSAEPSMLYRKWDGQATGQAAHVDGAEWTARVRILEQRAAALAALHGPDQPSTRRYAD